MRSVISVIDTILSLYGWVIILYIIFHWCYHFNIFNPYHPFPQKIFSLLQRLCVPFLSWIRKWAPSLNGLDLSPMIGLFILFFIRLLLHEYMI